MYSISHKLNLQSIGETAYLHGEGERKKDRSDAKLLRRGGSDESERGVEDE